MDTWDSSFIKGSFLLSGIREVIRKIKEKLISKCIVLSHSNDTNKLVKKTTYRGKLRSKHPHGEPWSGPVSETMTS